MVGLTARTGFWGYSRWQSADGIVYAGIIMLDWDFERSGSPYQGFLRAHELGHALGYNHVTSRTSIMNSSARYSINTFDIDAFRIAFQRPPGNRSPDTDPDQASVNVASIAPTWGPPIR
jgi:Matrixin